MAAAPLPPPSEPNATRTERTIEKTRRNGLPRSHAAKIWAGHGSSKRCDGCDEPITEEEREFEAEVVDHGTFRFHTECHAAWIVFSRHAGNAPNGSDAAE
jgi:hypothetical protein